MSTHEDRTEGFFAPAGPYRHQLPQCQYVICVGPAVGKRCLRPAHPGPYFCQSCAKKKVVQLQLRPRQDNN